MWRSSGGSCSDTPRVSRYPGLLGDVRSQNPARGAGLFIPSGGSGQGGFVGRGLTDSPALSSELRQGLGLGRSLHGIIHYRLQNSQEPGNIPRRVCQELGLPFPSGVCSVSGGIKAPLAAGRGILHPGRGLFVPLVWLVKNQQGIQKSCVIVMAGKMRLVVVFEKEEPR